MSKGWASPDHRFHEVESKRMFIYTLVVTFTPDMTHRYPLSHLTEATKGLAFIVGEGGSR
jgi:hypothetical protein